MDSSRLDNLEDDLFDLPTVVFPAMLKALLMRFTSLGQPIREEPAHERGKRTGLTIQKSRSLAERNLRTIKESVSEFCNGTTAHALQLKDSLRKG